MKSVLLTGLFLVIGAASAADDQQKVQWSYTYPAPYNGNYGGTRVFNGQLQSDSNGQPKSYSSSEEVGNFPAEAQASPSFNQDQRSSSESEGESGVALGDFSGQMAQGFGSAAQAAAAPAEMAAKMAASGAKMAESVSNLAAPVAAKMADSVGNMAAPMVSSVGNMAAPMVSQVAKMASPAIAEMTKMAIQSQGGGFAILDLLVQPILQVLKQISPMVGTVAEMVYSKLKAVLGYFKSTMAQEVQSRMLEESGQVQGRGLLNLVDPLALVRTGISGLLALIPGLTIAFPKILIDLKHVDWVALPIFLFETVLRIIGFFIGKYIPFVPGFLEIVLGFAGFIKTPILTVLRQLWPIVQPFIMKVVGSILQVIAQKIAPSVINSALS